MRTLKEVSEELALTKQWFLGYMQWNTFGKSIEELGEMEAENQRKIRRLAQLEEEMKTASDE